MNRPDSFQYNYYNIRKGETVYINEGGEWVVATVIKPLPNSVVVIVDGNRLQCAYSELRRKI